MPNDHARVTAAMSELIKLMVEHPHEVSVHLFEENGEVVLRSVVSQADIGKLIGKQGRTARSLRTILHAIGKTTGNRYMLDISSNPAHSIVE
jgi:predicted RNA-binding protein YlqC (UPF0109 family)